MKTLLIATAMLAGFAWAEAQEPDVSNGSPSLSGSLAPLSPADEGSLLPSGNSGSGLILYPQAAATPEPAPAEALPEAVATPTPEPTPVSSAATKGSVEQLRQAIRIRELKTQVLEDPEVQAQKAGADCAKTDEGRRVWMRNYYTLLYTRMEKIEPSLYEVLEAELYGILVKYEQHSVRPSVLIECVQALPGSCSADHKPAQAAASSGKAAKSKKASKFPR